MKTTIQKLVTMMWLFYSSTSFTGKCCFLQWSSLMRPDETLMQVSVSDTVRPVCLPSTGEDISAGSPAWITGWGALYSSGGTITAALLNHSFQAFPFRNKTQHVMLSLYSAVDVNLLTFLRTITKRTQSSPGDHLRPTDLQ